MFDLNKPFHPRYSHQIVFDFNLTNGLTKVKKALLTKAQKYRFEKHSFTVNITVDPSGQIIYNPFMMQLAFMDSSYRSRFYILAHCNAGSEFIYTDNAMPITAEQLVQLIMQYIPATSNLVTGGDPNAELKISLLACEAGLPDGRTPIPVEHINNSFAARLLYQFNQWGIKAAIAARLGLVVNLPRPDTLGNDKIEEMQFYTAHDKEAWQQCIRDYDTYILARKAELDKADPIQKEIILAEMNMFINKSIRNSYSLTYPKSDSRSKVIYCYIGGQQSITNAYQNSPTRPIEWRTAVINAINFCVSKTLCPVKQCGLLQLLNTIFSLPAEKIYEILDDLIELRLPGNDYNLYTPSTVAEIPYFSALSILTQVRDSYHES